MNRRCTCYREHPADICPVHHEAFFTSTNGTTRVEIKAEGISNLCDWDTFQETIIWMHKNMNELKQQAHEREITNQQLTSEIIAAVKLADKYRKALEQIRRPGQCTWTGYAAIEMDRIAEEALR